MKITIDTTSDSHDQIRKAIRLLQSIIEHDPASGSRNIFDSPSADIFSSSPAPSEPAASPTSAFGAMFGDNAPAQQSTELPKEKKPRIELY